MRVGVRNGVTRASFNSDFSNALPFEVLIVSLAAGYLMSSPWAFLLTLFVLTTLLFSPIGFILVYLVSAAWAVIPVVIAYHGWGLDAAIVTGICTFLASLGIHEASLQYWGDL